GRGGDFVFISVADTGSGMTPDVLERACEPFFTTKDVGKGTGLGLSMVYGFLQQSGGRLDIQSEPGVGTTVTLCLPRAHEGSDADAIDPRVAAGRSRWSDGDRRQARAG